MATALNTTTSRVARLRGLAAGAGRVKLPWIPLVGCLGLGLGLRDQLFVIVSSNDKTTGAFNSLHYSSLLSI